MSPKQVLSIALVAVALLVGISSVGNLAENLDSKEVMVIQGAVDGQLHVYTTPGLYAQNFGKVTHYPRRSIHAIEKLVRFNDGGHATLKGTIQWEMPVDEKSIIELHKQFGSPEAIDNQLIETVVAKSIYMTGPLMSSKESYAEKRPDLLRYVEDQINDGVYRTRQKDVKVKDAITGQDKTATAVEIVLDDKGLPARQEDAVLKQYGLKTYGLSITNLEYDDQVEKQIKGQQQLAMDVQTSIADAKKAEQTAITVEQNGKAAAAKAKWEQEVEKAKAVTAAEQELEVATLARKTAEQQKQATILEAQGEAEKQALIRQANGNLDQKLEAWKFAQEKWAAAFASYKGQVVPSVIMGAQGTGTNGGTGINQFMELLSAKAARDLGVDVTPAQQK